MRKEWILIGAGVALVAVFLVAGQLLLTGGRAAGPIGGTLPSSATTGASSVANPTTGATTATAGASSSDTTRPLSPLPPSQSGLKPIAPQGPLPEGQPLPPLSSSPNVISGFGENVVPNGSAYRITLRPWGMGPSAPTGRTAVITVYSIAAVGDAPAKFGSLRGRVLLVVMDSAGGGTMERGGTYSAVLTLVAAGGRLVPTVSQVGPTSP